METGDQSVPQTDVAETSAPDSSSSQSFDDKLAAKLGLSDTPDSSSDSAAEHTSDVAPGELSADDLKADDAPTESDWLELDRKGEKRRVSKEEAKRLAQQGWDYSTNVEALKAEKQAIEQAKAAVMARAKITPQVVDAAANVRYFERALAQYQNVDWVRLAQENPLEHPAHYAQFQQLREGYGQSMQQLQTAQNASTQVDSALSQAHLQQERTKLLDSAPEWRDEQRFSTDVGRIRKYLSERGLSEQEIAGIADSRSVLVARDAMRYHEAMKAKGERQTKQVPPVLKPGVGQPRANPATQYQDNLKALHQAKDPDRKKALLDQVLEKKLARFIPSR